MMRRTWLTLGLLCLVILTFGQANAALEVKAISPQATDGAITLAEADSFHVDIWMKVGDGDPELPGGTFAFDFYSPDGSITNLTHLETTAGEPGISTQSVETLNDFLIMYNFGLLSLENGWGNGSLPDTISLSFAGMFGLMTSADPDQPYIRFNLRVSNDGILCINDTHAGGDFDWIFIDPYNFTPQCWTIGDYTPDLPPEITCPADAEVECNTPYDPSVTGTATATDDNDTPTVTYSDSPWIPGSCPSLFTFIRTWTATDSKPQSSNCDQIITIVDKLAPVLTIPADITVECEGNDEPANTGTATANDSCDDTPIVDYNDNRVGDVITRTWTATDACGNTAFGDQIITIEDTTPPVVTCPADIVVDNETGTCSAVVNFTIVVSDNCLGVTVVTQPASGFRFSLGTMTVTATATDDAGNESICTFTVTVNDVEPPTISCPDPVTLLCGADINDPANTGTATGTDICNPSVNITYTDSDPVDGVVTRTWMAADNWGKIATCEQLITLAVDNDPPEFVEVCPADVTVQCDAVPEPATMTATDNCGVANVTMTEDRTDGACANSYTLVRTWTAEDGSANTVECVQTITIVDTTPPVLTSCPDAITLYCGTSTDPANTGTPVATDNCTDPVYTFVDGEITDGSFMRTWTIADACDNSITCDQIITVEDDVDAPVFVEECPLDITVECDAVPVADVLTATDNCGDVTVNFTEVRTDGSCEFDYTITRTWSVTDDSENSNTCVQIITVEDTEAPVFTNCPADVSVPYGESSHPDFTGYPAIEDNCDPNPTLDPYIDGEKVGDVINGFVFTRSWTATDLCGNSSECLQVITEEGMGEPFLIADLPAFEYEAKEFDIIEGEMFNIFERYSRQVLITDVTSSEPWLMITSNFPLSTPNVVFFDIDLSNVTFGDYLVTISVISDEAQNAPLEIPVNVHVNPFIAPPDSVWVSTVPAVPGGKAVVPVYFKNNDPLTRVNVPMEWAPDYLEFDSVSFIGSRVAYISDFEKGYSFSNDLNQVQITIDPTFSPYIPGGRGLLAKLYFSVNGGVETPAFVGLNSVVIPPDGYIHFEDETGEEDIPIYSPGGVVIDDQVALVCGSVVEIIDGIKEPVVGATVEFWDDFPVGAMQAEEMTDGNGQFACGTLGIVPFDAYAYKEGYYPGTVSDIDFGTLGIEILLTRVPEVATSNSWTLYFSGEFYDGTCMSYFFNIPLPVGSVVDAYTNEQPAVHCGTDYVDFAGQYSMSVYGDNPQTPEKDGAMEGDEIKFFINGYPAETVAPVYWSSSNFSEEICFDLFRVETRTIELAAGRNLISWNIDTPSDEIAVLFNDIMDNVSAILGFESGGFTYDPAYPEFSTLLYADHLHGYWVEMTNPDVLTITGSPVAPTTPIALESEWNLVSYLPDMAYEPAEALAGIHDQLDVVFGWIGDDAYGYEAAHPEYATLHSMEAGYGYWVYMFTDMSLVYPGVGPETIFGQGSAKLQLATIDGKIATSRFWTNIYSSNLTLDGITVPHGAEVLVVAPDNRVVGSGTVGENGRFGFVPVYGDDPLTSKIDGLQNGETFSLVIDGVKTDELFTRISDSHRMEVNAVTTAKSGDRLLPDQFGLAQNYPNPFNPTTAISFSIPNAASVTLEIFNILGEKVATPFNGMATSGINEVIWDGKNESGIAVASGIYFYRMKTDDFEKTRKMVLMK